MTKDNAKGLTYGTIKKLEELVGILCSADLVDAQGLDVDCDVDKMAEAVGHLTQAKLALKSAYDWRK